MGHNLLILEEGMGVTEGLQMFSDEEGCGVPPAVLDTHGRIGYSHHREKGILVSFSTPHQLGFWGSCEFVRQEG